MEIPQFVRELLTASLIMRTNEKLQMNKEMSEKHVFWQPWLNSAGITIIYFTRNVSRNSSFLLYSISST